MYMIKYPQKTFDLLALVFICCVSFLYAAYGQVFAKLHLSIPYYGIPVFTGEFFLFLCIVLICLRYLLFKTTLNISTLAWLSIGSYVIFIAIKIYLGYPRWGILSLRHAALFYYPLFILVGYAFYRREVLTQSFFIILTTSIIVLFVMRQFYIYYIFPLSALCLLSILKCKNRYLRLTTLCLLLCVLPYSRIFDTGRTRIVGNAIGFTAMFSLIVYTAANMNKRKLIIATSIFMLCLIFLIINIADQNAIRSLTHWDEIRLEWRLKTKKIQNAESTFAFRTLQTTVYRPTPHHQTTDLKSSLNQETLDLTGNFTRDGSNLQTNNGEPPKNQPRSLEEARNNILFRVFIWRDMLHDLIIRKPLFGMDFGYPFRSKSLEILNWGSDAWESDGWIASHNSYFEIIYRSGIIGLVLIVLLMAHFVRMTLFFMRMRSITGAILSSIFLYWFTVAHFTISFEVPYTAITLWLLLGFTTAYYVELQLKADTHLSTKSQIT
jgi:hypothetical protein